MNTSATSHASSRHELRFQSLFREGRAWAFPCDAQGHVDMDAMSERLRTSYFFVRSVIGREVATPRVLLAS